MSDEILLAQPKKRKHRGGVALSADVPLSETGATVAQAEAVLNDNGRIKQVAQVVNLPKWRTEICEIHVIGKTPLIVHAWSEKAVREMLSKHMGEASEGREKKDPFANFKGTLYPIPGEKFAFGVPAPSFKACAVSAANSVQLQMTKMKMAFHVESYTVPVYGEPIKTPVTEWDAKYKKELAPYHAIGISMRMDVVRLETGVADLRFRAWWPKWKAKIQVEYNPKLISLAQLLNLFRAGGFGCGIGEWRPSAPVCRSGEFGRFEIETK